MSARASQDARTGRGRDLQPRSELPIGVFDSGVGGLTVLRAIRRALPSESAIYLGDTARVPYGTKSPDSVLRYSLQASDLLVKRGIKLLVVACNTASALALPNLDMHEVPTWGVIEPGAYRAAAVSRGKVGVIATEATVRSDAYPRALRTFRPELEIVSRSCPLLGPLVEEGWHDDPITEEVARRYLEPLLEAGIDTLVLGCTHYPLLVPVLQRVAGPGVTLVDSAEAAVASSERQRHLVLATEATVSRRAYTQAIRARRPQAHVEEVACSLLVSLAEEGWTEGPIAESVVGRYVASYFARAAAERPDTIILGCTHFPLLAAAIRAAVGPAPQIIDSASTTARFVAATLEENRALASRTERAKLQLLATDGPARFARLGARFLGESLAEGDVELVDL